MSIDVLQDKIRKLKNPSMVDLTIGVTDLPPHLLREEGSPAKAYGRFCRELLQALKGQLPAVRLSFTPFSILGPEGLEQLQRVMHAAAADFYVALDAPDILSPKMAAAVADALAADGIWPCDAVVMSMYPGTDCVKAFLPFCRDLQKDIFPVLRTSNKSAPEIQDLLTGSRLVHMAAADLIDRFGDGICGRCGYARVGAMAGGSSAESLRSLRAKYSRMFLLIDDIDYSNCNAKNCSNAFDKFGHGAVVCIGPTISAAWQQSDSDGTDYLDQAVQAAERMKRNLTRYVTIL